jgi:hypothetical protein
MNSPNFHDGYFDGFRLESDKTIYLFLRASNRQHYTLTLTGLQALTVSGVRPGNIILDLTFRSSREATRSDIHELYDVDEDSEQATKLLTAAQEKKIQILELNPSYGAQGLFLFENFEFKETVDTTVAGVARR